jgi:hypothetical protein
MIIKLLIASKWMIVFGMAYGEKKFVGHDKDPNKATLANYGPWDRLDGTPRFSLSLPVLLHPKMEEIRTRRRNLTECKAYSFLASQR